MMQIKYTANNSTANSQIKGKWLKMVLGTLTQMAKRCLTLLRAPLINTPTALACQGLLSHPSPPRQPPTHLWSACVLCCGYGAGVSSLMPLHSYTSLILSSVTPASFMSNSFFLKGSITDKKSGKLTYGVIHC